MIKSRQNQIIIVNMNKIFEDSGIIKCLAYNIDSGSSEYGIKMKKIYSSDGCDVRISSSYPNMRFVFFSKKIEFSQYDHWGGLRLICIEEREKRHFVLGMCWGKLDNESNYLLQSFGRCVNGEVKLLISGNDAKIEKISGNDYIWRYKKSEAIILFEITEECAKKLSNGEHAVINWHSADSKTLWRDDDGRFVTEDSLKKQGLDVTFNPNRNWKEDPEYRVSKDEWVEKDEWNVKTDRYWNHAFQKIISGQIQQETDERIAYSEKNAVFKALGIKSTGNLIKKIIFVIIILLILRWIIENW